MNAAWQPLQQELARWRDAGRPVELWWRDDDAARMTPELNRLLALASRASVPIALAVVPAVAERKWLAALGPGVALLQHGYDHRDRSGEGEKKTEYPASEPATRAVARLAKGREQLASLAGERALPVLAPPWNRLPEALASRLPEAGLSGLSSYGPRRRARPAPGVLQVNTHVDVIAWKAGRDFVGEREALELLQRHLGAKRSGEADAGEPTGLLTHHAVHDERAWSFLERLFEVTARATGVRWRGAAALFGAAG